VSGVLKNQMGELPFEGATLTGDELKFMFTVNFQGTPLPITLTGKVKGSTIDGKADFGGMAEGDWTAKRVDTTMTKAMTPGGPAEATPASAKSGGVAGKWDVVFKTPQGDFPATATLTADGAKLSGTLGSQLGETAVTGTLDGTKISLSLVVNSPQGDLNVSMTGEVMGDSINGMADVSAMGQMEWSAKRAKQ
jgi:hypothetical protein